MYIKNYYNLYFIYCQVRLLSKFVGAIHFLHISIHLKKKRSLPMKTPLCIKSNLKGTSEICMQSGACGCCTHGSRCSDCQLCCLQFRIPFQVSFRSISLLILTVKQYTYLHYYIYLHYYDVVACRSLVGRLLVKIPFQNIPDALRCNALTGIACWTFVVVF